MATIYLNYNKAQTILGNSTLAEDFKQATELLFADLSRDLEEIIQKNNLSLELPPLHLEITDICDIGLFPFLWNEHTRLGKTSLKITEEPSFFKSRFYRTRVYLKKLTDFFANIYRDDEESREIILKILAKYAYYYNQLLAEYKRRYLIQLQKNVHNKLKKIMSQLGFFSESLLVNNFSIDKKVDTVEDSLAKHHQINLVYGAVKNSVKKNKELADTPSGLVRKLDEQRSADALTYNEIFSLVSKNILDSYYFFPSHISTASNVRLILRCSCHIVGIIASAAAIVTFFIFPPLALVFSLIALIGFFPVLDDLYDLCKDFIYGRAPSARREDIIKRAVLPLSMIALIVPALLINTGIIAVSGLIAATAFYGGNLLINSLGILFNSYFLSSNIKNYVESKKTPKNLVQIKDMTALKDPHYFSSLVNQNRPLKNNIRHQPPTRAKPISDSRETLLALSSSRSLDTISLSKGKKEKGKAKESYSPPTSTESIASSATTTQTNYKSFRTSTRNEPSTHICSPAKPYVSIPQYSSPYYFFYISKDNYSKRAGHPIIKDKSLHWRDSVATKNLKISIEKYSTLSCIAGVHERITVLEEIIQNCTRWNAADNKTGFKKDEVHTIFNCALKALEQLKIIQKDIQSPTEEVPSMVLCYKG